MKLIFLGPPGAGKGTMAGRTKDLLGIPHVSTGALFRENIADQTPLGLAIKETMDEGSLVTDEITVALVTKRLDRPDAATGFILDGFPRTIPQAVALSEIRELDHVINLSCPTEELVRRLTGRRQCPVCGRIFHIDFVPPKIDGKCDDDGTELSIREDDKLEAVKNRLKVYADSTHPLVTWYKDHGLLRIVDASKAPDGVFDAIKGVIGY
jgi:adenylate kinase